MEALHPKSTSLSTNGHRSPDDLVMGTNSSSIVSKRSVERLYYPHGPHFFRYFVPKFQRRAPLINRGYWLRLKAIDTVVNKFLSQTSPLKKVVVNLGCGSDVLPWQCDSRWPNLSQDTLFVDVDFKDLLEKKRRVILATPELRSLLGPFEIGGGSSPLLLKSRRYCQVGCDLRELPLLKEVLSGLVGGSVSEASFLFVAEVSITYLETKSADEVIQWASTLGDSSFCLLEQIIPDGPFNPFARTMLAHFDKLKTPLRSVLCYPDLHSQNRRFLSRGWQNVRSWTLWEVWADPFFISPEERSRLDDYEPFDEWEEFALFASHYVVLWATTMMPTPAETPNEETPWPSPPPCVLSKLSLDQRTRRQGYRRFGAAMLVQDPHGQEYISHVMGHGERSRLSSVDIYTVSPGQLEMPAHSSGPTARVCHTLTDLGPHGILLVGGRTSPSNALQDCWLFRPAVGSWERAQDLPSPVFRHAILRLGKSSLALLVGGKTNHRRVSARSYVYHPQHGWLTCNVDGVQPAVFGANLCLINRGPSSSIYEGLLVGGMSPDGIHRQQVLHWVLEVSGTDSRITFRHCDDTGKRSAGMMRLLSRFGATLLNHGRHVILVGGVTANHQLPQTLDVLILHASSCGLKIVGSVGVDHDVPQEGPFFIGSAAVTHPDGRIIVLGGGGTCFSMGTCWSAGTFKFSLDVDREPVSSRHLAPPVTYTQTWEILPLCQDSGTLRSSTLSSTPITRVRLESRNQFDEILSACLPLVLTGADVGTCVSIWTPDYLVRSIGADCKVSVHETSSLRMDFNTRNFSYINTRFADFMMQAQNNGRVYLRSLSEAGPSSKAANIAEDFPELSKDFYLPPELETATQNIHSSVLRISGPVDMWLHYDVMANVYVQVRGTRKLVLFHPRYVTCLGFQAGASSSSIDVFKALEDGSIKGVESFEAVLGPGDMLFLPPLWLHAAQPVTNLSIAVNVFFRNLKAGYAPGRDIYGNRDLVAYERGRADIHKIASTFDRLPRDTVEFYIRRLAEELLSSGKGSV